MYTPIVCDDSGTRARRMRASAGPCVYTPIVCDDGSACTADACVGGTCEYTPITCDDGSALHDGYVRPGDGMRVHDRHLRRQQRVHDG